MSSSPIRIPRKVARDVKSCPDMQFAGEARRDFPGWCSALSFVSDERYYNDSTVESNGGG